VAWDLDSFPERTVEMLHESAFAALTTTRPDGRPHTAVVGFSWDAATRQCWFVLRGSGVKFTNLTASGGAQPVTLCQTGAGGRWLTLEGIMRLVRGAGPLAESLTRYRERYGAQIGDDPTRICAVLDVDRAYGTG
jgi:F420H(2)-dependent biliverdin reductase